MTGEDLPYNSHVVRYARPSLIRDDGSVGGEAFQLRNEESGLSINWLEGFARLPVSKQLDEIRRLSRIRMRPNGRLAKLHVGDTIRHASSELDNLRFTHQPLPAEGSHEADPSHSEILGLPPADSPEAELIGDVIAECIQIAYPAATEVR